MSSQPEPTSLTPPGPDRRQFLRAAGLVSGGVVAGAAVGAAAGVIASDHSSRADHGEAADAVPQVVAFYGSHQPGVTDRAPAHLRFLSFSLADAVLSGGRSAVGRLQRRLSDAAAAMMAGSWIEEQGSALAGMRPAALTVTFGFGARLIEAAGRQAPPALAPLPAFPGDALHPRLSGGDLAIQVCGQDEMVVSSVARALVLLAGEDAPPKWIQSGFLPGVASANQVGTPRNLMGQLDGTDNPTGARLELAVWLPPGATPSWMSGGSYLVSRRIRMLLNAWSTLPVVAKEAVIGRSLATGGPLTGGTEHAVPNFTALNQAGHPVIATDSHLRLTHPANNSGATMLRRGYSYDDGLLADGQPDAGLFFQAFQTDPRAVFVPIQQKLARTDALSKFIRHESSSVFAIPPGASRGGWVGETLFGG